MRVLPRHQVFIIYSQSEPAPFALTRALADALIEVGVTLPGYEEMDWFIERQPDVASFSIERIVNTPLLNAYFTSAVCAVIVAQRLTEGVRIELELLGAHPQAPPILVVDWGCAPGERADLPGFHEYRIGPWHDADLSRHVNQLRGHIWFAKLLLDLAFLNPLGALIVDRHARRGGTAAAIVASSPRFPAALREAAAAARGRASAEPHAGEPVELPADVSIREAVQFSRYWRGGASTLTTRVAMRASDELGDELQAFRALLYQWSIAIEDRFPDDAVMDGTSYAGEAEACFRLDIRGSALKAVAGALDSVQLDDAGRYSMLMLRAALQAESPATASRALDDFAAALAIPDLPPVFRHNALVNRAALCLEMKSDRAAIDDLDAVLADSSTLSEHMRFSAHYQRGLARFRLRRLDEAVADYSAVADDSRAPDATRQSARLRRGSAHLERGALPEARRDYEAVLADTRASESTRETARAGLGEIERRSKEASVG